MIVAILKENWLEIAILGLLVIVTGMTGYEIGKQSAMNYSISSRDVVLHNDTSNEAELVKKIEDLNSNNSSSTAAFPATNHLNNQDDFSYDVVYGSVNGSKYYNYGCKSGNRVKDENRIYFADETAALLAGYEPSINCDF